MVLPLAFRLLWYSRFLSRSTMGRLLLRHRGLMEVHQPYVPSLDMGLGSVGNDERRRPGRYASVKPVIEETLIPVQNR